MKIINASYVIESCPRGNECLQALELYGRNCYKSEDKITDASAARFVASLIKNKHFSVLEHQSITVRLICDRGVSHELVRHRLASYSQESTRYAAYNKDKFGGEITVIRPCFWSKESVLMKWWEITCEHAEGAYLVFMKEGAKAEEARSVLPNSLKTEVVMTANLHEWRHVLTVRTAKAAHPQMREIMIPLLAEFKSRIPVVFDDIEVEL